MAQEIHISKFHLDGLDVYFVGLFRFNSSLIYMIFMILLI